MLSSADFIAVLARQRAVVKYVTLARIPIFMHNSGRIAVLASGGGSNARKIIEYFKQRDSAEVCLVVSDNSNAGVLGIASEHEIPSVIASKEQRQDGNWFSGLLKDYDVNFIALAGYLKMIPEALTKEYTGRMVNIHPALLPKFGGKGMYGMNVHRAVVEARETESGITIHYVNENYDEGAVIFQDRCPVHSDDSPEQVQARVLRLEHANYPRVIEETLLEVD